jgi:hypothetical protein
MALQVIRGFNGWYVYDKNGLHAGPFKVAAEAYAMVKHAA